MKIIEEKNQEINGETIPLKVMSKEPLNKDLEGILKRVFSKNPMKLDGIELSEEEIMQLELCFKFGINSIKIRRKKESINNDIERKINRAIKKDLSLDGELITASEKKELKEIIKKGLSSIKLNRAYH